ncbi:hypothetical protein NDU88_006518 [Pleurodeles waltl]|uniref:Uncharacterized protein n=1 Tax=Pleurodeles waltl TaxID=8319 RepID=A0AAV7TXV8_PLEWA|nr:hypothetical protein NDU88_006518 [Pleurodeles waltl]
MWWYYYSIVLLLLLIYSVPQGGLSPSRPPEFGPVRLQALSNWGSGGGHVSFQQRFPHSSLRVAPIQRAGSVSGSQAPLTPSGRPSARQAGPGWVGRNTQYTSPGGTTVVGAPWRSHGFSQRRVQQGTGGTCTEPTRHEQVRPAAPCKGRDVASTSQDIQWAPGPGFFSACLRDSPTHWAGPAAGPQSPCAAARSSQALSRVVRQGPAGAERSAQLTSPGGTSPVPRPMQQGDPVASVGRSASGGPRGPGAPALLPQSSARRDQARPAASGNGGGAASTHPAPLLAPPPPARSSPKMCTGGRPSIWDAAGHRILTCWWAVSVRSGSHLGHAAYTSMIIKNQGTIYT